jgi:hypothetical protein
VENFPRLYNITMSQNCSVAEVISSNFRSVRFRRNIWGETASMWVKVIQLCENVILSQEEDSVRWVLTKSGVFSVQSMYLVLKLSQVKWPHRKLWFIRVPS